MSLLKRSNRLWLSSCLAVAAAAMFVSPVLAQKAEPAKDPKAPAASPFGKKPEATKPADAKPESKPETKPDTKSKDAAADAAKPGAFHAWLANLEGEWAVEDKTVTPGEEHTDPGTWTSKMSLGGRFLMSDYDGRSRGKFYKGHSVWGYNNADKRFEYVWVDTQGTGMLILTGTADAAGKVVTLTGSMTDPTGGKKVNAKAVVTILSKDSFTFETFDDSSGTMAKVAIATATRSGKAAKDEPSAKKPADAPADKKSK